MSIYLQLKYFMKIQSSVLVPLGFGKYVRSDRVTALVPIEEERGSRRRTFVYLEGYSKLRETSGKQVLCLSWFRFSRISSREIAMGQMCCGFCVAQV